MSQHGFPTNPSLKKFSKILKVSQKRPQFVLKISIILNKLLTKKICGCFWKKLPSLGPPIFLDRQLFFHSTGFELFCRIFGRLATVVNIDIWGLIKFNTDKGKPVSDAVHGRCSLSCWIRINGGSSSGGCTSCWCLSCCQTLKKTDNCNN